MQTSNQEWQEWAQHPLTQEFKSILGESIEETGRAWADEAYVSDSMEKTALVNAKALGGVDALRKVIVQLEAAKAGEFHE